MSWIWLIILIIVLLIIYIKIIKSENSNKYIQENEKERTGKEWYREYLKTDHWLELREEALKRAGNRCQVCAYKKNLHVHHNTYKNIGHEDLEDLVVLCWKCHKTFHRK